MYFQSLFVKCTLKSYYLEGDLRSSQIKNYFERKKTLLFSHEKEMDLDTKRPSFTKISPSEENNNMLFLHFSIRNIKQQKCQNTLFRSYQNAFFSRFPKSVLARQIIRSIIVSYRTICVILSGTKV